MCNMQTQKTHMKLAQGILSGGTTQNQCGLLSSLAYPTVVELPSYVWELCSSKPMCHPEGQAVPEMFLPFSAPLHTNWALGVPHYADWSWQAETSCNWDVQARKTGDIPYKPKGPTLGRILQVPKVWGTLGLLFYDETQYLFSVGTPTES